MERIDPTGSSFRPLSERRKKRVREKEREGASFLTILETEQQVQAGGAQLSFTDSPQADTLEELLDDIYGIGEKVKKNPTLATIKSYREAVRKFMAIVVKHGLELEEKRIVLEPILPSAIDRLYGKYEDSSLLADLEREHRQELEDEQTHRP